MSRRLSTVLVAVCVAALLAWTCLVRIGPDEVGVRVDNLSVFGSRGIVPQDFGPGWHLGIPGVQAWTVFASRVRRVEMTSDDTHRSPIGTDALTVQSADGDRVSLNMDIFFRIAPGSAHVVLQDSGAGDGHVALLRSLAGDTLRVVFGALTAEQYYDASARQAKTAEALAALNKSLGPRGIEVVDIAVQEVEFEPKYEQEIKDKKLADQTVELSKAEARAAVERAKVATIQLDTSRQVGVIAAHAKAEVDRITAEASKYQADKQGTADVYSAQQKAAGALALGKAQATVKRAQTIALAGSGGANFAALQAVDNLKIDTIQFPTSGSDWFDVQDMASKLGARP